jgi:hypothetical protein
VLNLKLVEQYGVITKRIAITKQEQQEQEKAAADRKDEEECPKHDAATREPEQEFVPVESRAPAHH